MRIGDWSSDVCSSDLVTNTIKPAPSLCRPGFAFFTAATVRLPILLSHTVSHIMRCLAVDVNGQCCTNKIEECKYFRSEEHTSELQSLMRISYAVFCLKKKTHRTKTILKSRHDITPNKA